MTSQLSYVLLLLSVLVGIGVSGYLYYRVALRKNRKELRTMRRKMKEKKE